MLKNVQIYQMFYPSYYEIYYIWEWQKKAATLFYQWNGVLFILFMATKVAFFFDRSRIVKV